MTKKGTLTVTVRSAEDLDNTDFVGRSDPYVKLILDHNNVQTTTIKKAELNPKYNETFVFNVNGQKHLDIEVWDKDSVTSDDLIGKAEISLSHVFSKGTESDVKVTVKRGLRITSKGEVTLDLTFTEG